MFASMESIIASCSCTSTARSLNISLTSPMSRCRSRIPSSRSAMTASLCSRRLVNCSCCCCCCCLRSARSRSSSSLSTLLSASNPAPTEVAAGSRGACLASFVLDSLASASKSASSLRTSLASFSRCASCCCDEPVGSFFSLSPHCCASRVTLSLHARTLSLCARVSALLPMASTSLRYVVTCVLSWNASRAMAETSCANIDDDPDPANTEPDDDPRPE
mmetsp:Transcript_3489/g.7683  ORF Transcript_3489/g.7683 Transcript_3489/m.7683 type:complete len:219 (+) Transcript_3489:1323-1979(+)